MLVCIVLLLFFKWIHTLKDIHILDKNSWASLVELIWKSNPDENVISVECLMDIDKVSRSKNPNSFNTHSTCILVSIII